jgi:hypothetical protein
MVAKLTVPRTTIVPIVVPGILHLADGGLSAYRITFVVIFTWFNEFLYIYKV